MIKLQEKVKQLFQEFRSRKTILFILGIVYALLTVLKTQLGVSIDANATIYALGIITIYLVKEGKADLNRVLKELFQAKKWEDPKFWVAVSGVLMPVVLPLYGLDVPEGASAGVACLLMLLFKKEEKSV